MGDGGTLRKYMGFFVGIALLIVGNLRCRLTVAMSAA